MSALGSDTQVLIDEKHQAINQQRRMQIRCEYPNPAKMLQDLVIKYDVQGPTQTPQDSTVEAASIRFQIQRANGVNGREDMAVL